MGKLVIATGNKGKLEEIKALLAGTDWEIKSLTDFPHLPEVVEDELTFEGNARKKALEIARATGCWALADDSGLEVAALGGAPGVHSARYAGEVKDDARNNAKLLEELAGVPFSDREARFRCVMALAHPERGVVAVTEGSCPGIILCEARGEGGFGYDPLFYLPEKGKTMAELSPDEKNAVSHRGQALRKMISELERLARAGE
ncbi:MULTISPECIES: XTP/dITP diphosphatase [Carboxydocella]|uniref:dITP/XTP pyrophosphatase n=2 Tax=Carboxydocella TaxID=178898 RepID=A0A1T4LDW3_9FIRM|nr:MULTISPECIES: XTP/dITP diphosphatase [Carboxydocella]AVX19829.1 XTP/dITP diphosphohydrolase [Carboxydocella thermautotrophica]AVX30238.1 XTP/dITP diphosphohydrolase [Carboxydocella thermautotrophica]SJZ52959.1 XTP/dITP diphosphohydrolase [Carboxydocella sporoproducens DSM 16521]GAW28652.1 non-canonical purine NTP pyrophosphatase [Carboxydocella sp. ULO1]GAW31727.1 non-canonical purine NTP pyrophosphatase [Carboxydocella sp. JDF658]